MSHPLVSEPVTRNSIDRRLLSEENFVGGLPNIVLGPNDAMLRATDCLSLSNTNAWRGLENRTDGAAANKASVKHLESKSVQLKEQSITTNMSRHTVIIVSSS